MLVQASTTTVVIQQAGEFKIFKRDSKLWHSELLKRRHWWLKQEITEHAARVYLIGGLAWLLTLWKLKWCVLTWFMRIAHGMNSNGKGKKMILVIRAVEVIGLVTFVSGLVVTFVECSPLDELSQIHADPGTMCANSKVPLILIGASNILTDFIMLGISLPLVHMNSHRAPLFFLFALGMAATGSGFIRVITSMENQDDYVTTLWANAEILCACVVTNGPLIRLALQGREDDLESIDYYQLADPAAAVSKKENATA
ncbi:hypothetical protein BDZ91DRAFT_161135 [Kalaharituber pfeilii]|nr:hypothetical protein BDZ91DRAFT_161135 [Kalaharituber pfeilii]